MANYRFKRPYAAVVGLPDPEVPGRTIRVEPRQVVDLGDLDETALTEFGVWEATTDPVTIPEPPAPPVADGTEDASAGEPTNPPAGDPAGAGTETPPADTPPADDTGATA